MSDAAATMMQAIQMHEPGGPQVLQLERVARPQRGPGEALIEVAAAGVNPIDWKVRSRGGRELPFILGWDAAGVVRECEPGGGLAPGDPVYAMTAIPKGGAYAQYVSAPAVDVAPLPRSLSFAEAAAVPLAALTAWQALFDVSDLRAGQTVLVHAAAGGVGQFAVQLAHWAGARVLGTTSGRNAEFVRGLGADEVIDYTSTSFEDVAAAVDVVLDAVGGDTLERSLAVVRPGGSLVSIAGQPDAAEAERLGVGAKRILVHPDGRLLRIIGALLDTGSLKVDVEAVFPIADVADAHVRSEGRHTRGKLVLDVSPALAAAR